MDAYLFVDSATSEATAALTSRAAPEGPVRVVLPLAGERALYVAVAAPDEASLTAALTDVSSSQGLSGVNRHVAVGDLAGVELDPTRFPTHCAVRAWVGFAVLGFDPGFTGTLLEQDGVVGVAAVRSDEGDHLLVEVTADSETGVQAALSALASLAGLRPRLTAIGEAAGGAGLRAE